MAVKLFQLRAVKYVLISCQTSEHASVWLEWRRVRWIRWQPRILRRRGCSAQRGARTMLMRPDANAIDTSARGVPAVEVGGARRSARRSRLPP